MATWIQRVIGAAKLDAATYEEVEADRSATGQAMAVVVLSAIASGLGAINGAGARAFVQLTVMALVGWYLWAIVTWFIGTKLVPEPETRADLGELLRTIGFSSSPGLLRVLGVFPGIGWIVSLVTSVWMLASMIVAVRQALDYRSTGRAIVVCFLGFLVYVAVIAGAAIFMGLGAAVLGSFISRGATS